MGAIVTTQLGSSRSVKMNLAVSATQRSRSSFFGARGNSLALSLAK